MQCCNLSKILHNCLAEHLRILPKATYAVVGFDEYIAVVKPRWCERAELNRIFEGGTDAGGTKDQ